MKKHWLFNKIEAYSQDVAIVNDNIDFKYEQLIVQTQIYFDSLQKTIKKGEIVAILSDYSFYSIALFFALRENGNIIVPITSENEKEVKERLYEANVDFTISIENQELIFERCVFSIKEKHPLIIQILKENRAGLILFSSGSTGKPKAMVHELDNLLDIYQNKKKKRLNFMVFLMFDHIGGLNTLFNCLSMGVKIILPNSRNADHICELIEKYKVHILPSSPTFLNLIIISEAYNKFDLTSLKMVTYGTEPMQESLLLRLTEILPRVKFLQTFGTSETGIAKIISKSSTSTLIKIDDPNLEYKIIRGELWLKSKTQIRGYLNASMQQFSSDGWFMTGDLVELKEEGYLKIIGRSKEIINVGGEKVLPAELESIILQIPEVLDCVVFGNKNALTGQSVAVRVVLKEGVDGKTIKGVIRRFCRKKIDSFKIPTKVIVVNQVNYGSRFKKNRRES